MEALFLSILKMSATASAVILAVLLARLLLMRAPKKYSYFLWAAVGFRMCCPFSLKSEFSLFRLLMPRTIHQTPQETVPVAAGASPWYAFPAPAAQASSASPSPGNVAMYSATAQSGTLPVQTTASSGVNWLAVCAVIWIVGVVFLLGYSIAQEIRLRRSLATATRLRGNIYQSENVASPFLLGILRPRIYLPYSLPFRIQSYVIAHERYHMHRLDHLARRAAFLLLTLHWFNPLCWLAFHLMGKDMELSCDEGVLNNMRVSTRDYSTTLLAFATNHRFLAVSPLAFGETGVRSRIVNALKWKKPRLWRGLAGLFLSCAVIAACMTDPLATEDNPDTAVADAPLDCRRVEVVAQLDGRNELFFYDAQNNQVQWLNTYPNNDLSCSVLEGKRFFWDDNHTCIDAVDLDPNTFARNYDYIRAECPQRVEEYYSTGEQRPSVYELEYNEQKQLILKKELDENAKVSGEWKYFYGEDGRLKGEVFRAYFDGVPVDYETNISYQYTPEGWLSEKTACEAGVLLEEYSWQYDANGRCVGQHKSRNGYIYDWINYDQQGRIAREEYYDDNGVLVQCTRNEYSTQGQLVHQTENGPNGEMLAMRIFEYGADNRINKITQYNAENQLEVKEYGSFSGRSVLVREALYIEGMPIWENRRTCYDNGVIKTQEYYTEGKLSARYSYAPDGNEVEWWSYAEDGSVSDHESHADITQAEKSGTELEYANQ